MPPARRSAMPDGGVNADAGAGFALGSRRGLATRRRRRRRRCRRRRRRGTVVGRREREHAQQHHHQAAVFVGRERQLGAAGQDHAVEQLGLVGRHQRGEANDDLGVGIVAGDRVGDRLDHRHLLQQRRHLLERAGRRQAEAAQAVDRGDQRRAVARRGGLDAADRMAAIDRAEHLAHARFLDPAAAVGDRLVGERLGIAHRAARRARDQLQRARLGGDVLGREDRGEMLGDRRRRHRPQVELEAAREHRRRHLLRIGRGEDELEVVGRLLERLQHRVEGVAREHVHFVDQVDLEAADDRLVDRLVEQARDLLDAPVRRRIELDEIDEAAGVDVAARRAHAARAAR